MNEQSVGYLKKDSDDLRRVIRIEIWFTPLLIVLPLIVGGFLIYDWFCRDFSMNDLELTGELMLGVIILVGNVMFDIPFLKSLLRYRRR
jgi:hypothetical protein